jgi:hypothetical protein
VARLHLRGIAAAVFASENRRGLNVLQFDMVQREKKRLSAELLSATAEIQRITELLRRSQQENEELTHKQKQVRSPSDAKPNTPALRATRASKGRALTPLIVCEPIARLVVPTGRPGLAHQNCRGREAQGRCVPPPCKRLCAPLHAALSSLAARGSPMWQRIGTRGSTALSDSDCLAG